MPCSDGGPSREQVERERKEANAAKRLPPMLCSACRALERLGFDFDENPELSKWWDKHKKEDQARADKEEQERKRIEWEKGVIDAALKKPFAELSKEEIAMLKKHNYL